MFPHYTTLRFLLGILAFFQTSAHVWGHHPVEGFFARPTKRRLKRGVFVSLTDLQAAINRFVAEQNTQPKPFIWKADPDKIIAAVKRGHQVLESHH
jgi:hypothetical protein